MTDLQVNDVTWQKTSAGKFIPILKLWNKQSKEFNTFPLKDYRLNFILSEDKFCTGYSEKGKHFECPYNNNVTGGFNGQCGFCERVQGFKSSFIFGDLNHEKSEEILSKQYYIYLAYFEPGIIKVGTANVERNHLRLIEQDALIFAFIAKGTGYEIQKLEHIISKKLGITEIVKSNHKFKYLSLKPNIKTAESKLQSTFDRIKSTFKNDTTYSALFFDELKIENFLETAELFFPEKYKKFDDLILVGDFAGLRGRYLLLDVGAKIADQNSIAAFDINYLIGRFIENYMDSYEYNFTEEQLSLI